MKKRLFFVLLGISMAFAVLSICASMQVRATPDEGAPDLAGDNLIPQPIGSVNHAILRHESVSTTQRFYIKTAREDAMDAMKRFEEKLKCAAVVQQIVN
jgi:hypothetical protein